jgi:thioredoxin reductase
MYDLIILGGGAAGLSAAIYALGKQLDFLVIYENFGKAGMPQFLAGRTDAEFLAGAEAVRLFERQITIHTHHTLRDRVTDVAKAAGVFQVTTEQHGVQESMAVIVATGATPIGLDVPGAKELLGQGFAYSITTHASILAGRSVAVIGTTIRALQGVAELARTAAQIYLIAPDAAGLEMPMARALRQRPNVEILDGYAVKKISGPFNVGALVVERDGHPRWLKVDAAFVDLGLCPNSELVRRIVQTDPDGFIWVDERNATTMPGLFAAGDVTTAFGEQILIAIGDGARAALSAYDYLFPHLAAYEARPAD